jgi:DNA-binding NarL/FixJ family response regulator
VSRPRVLLADDHRVVSEGLKRLLADDFELVGMVQDGRALVAAAKKLQPDVIVADITMPHLNGIDAMAQLKKDNAGVKVVFLTHQDPAYARRALAAGAAGFVVKHSAPAELVMAIHAALKGQTFITPALASDVLRQIQHESREMSDSASPLTPRQREIALPDTASGRPRERTGPFPGSNPVTPASQSRSALPRERVRSLTRCCRKSRREQTVEYRRQPRRSTSCSGRR